MPLRFSIRAQAVRGEFAAEGCPGSLAYKLEVGLDSGEVVLGRALGVSIELPFPKVSARHARIFREAGAYRIEDLGSTNGTRLSGRRLAPHVPESIAIGESLDLGGVEVCFEGVTHSTDSLPGGESTASLARRLVHDIFEACPPSECARLLVLTGPAQGRELVLSASGRVFKLGRGEGCDFAIPDGDVSREHAAFERGAGSIVVRDLGSKNGVEVEGEKVAGQRCLRDGEIIRVGETRLRLIDPEDRYLRQMEAAEGCQQVVEAAPEGAAGAGDGGKDAAGSLASAADALPSLEVAASARIAARPSRLPIIAAATAATVLLLALGLVLALAFAVF